MKDNIDEVADYMAAAFQEFGGVDSPAQTTVVDFGCGAGELVDALRHLGFDAYGCDIDQRWSQQGAIPAHKRFIATAPYRLPFETNSVDVVISTSVLEHVQNKEESFREILRILKPGGFALHLFPSRWYLPNERHTFIPLANYFGKSCPSWWFALWTFLGIRNEHQSGVTWKTAMQLDQQYSQNCLSYWSYRRYHKVSMEIFGNCHWPMLFYIQHAKGGCARLCRRLPMKPLFGGLIKALRTGFLLQYKEDLPQERGGR